MATSLIYVHMDVGFGRFISIRGDAPLSWEHGVKLECVSADTWRWRIDHSQPIRLKALLNDRSWQLGPNQEIVPGDVLRIYPTFDQGPGWVSEVPLDARHFGSPIRVWVYHPPGFGQNRQKRYPVIYAMDGRNLFDDAERSELTSSEWRFDETSTSLIQSGLTEPILVVGVDFRDRLYDYIPWRAEDDGELYGGGADFFAQFLIHEVKARIDAIYPTMPGSETTAILGSSLGGLFAVYAGRRFPEVFGRVAALSPSLWWADQLLTQQVIDSQRHDTQRIYLDAGTREMGGKVAHHAWRLAEALRADHWVDGVDLKLEFFDADHTELAWARRLWVPLEFLFG